MLFAWNLSRRTFQDFLGQVLGLDLLLCTRIDSEHVFLFLCPIFTQRPTNDQKIERSDERALVGNKFLQNSSKISFHKKKSLSSVIANL